MSLKPTNLKIGDLFYECEGGMNIEAKVTEAVTEHEGFEGRKQWKWKAVNTQNGEEIDYLLTDGLSHYGPRIYGQPQYCHVKDGEFTFPLYGALKA